MKTKKETYLYNDVSINAAAKTVWEFFQLAISGKIAVLPEWLQRHQQTKKWRKAKGKKIRSFLRSFFTGNSVLTPFYMVHVDVLLDYIDDEIDNESDIIVKKVFQDMKKQLLEKKKSGVEFILLDGQNRLYEAIIPFFQSKLEYNKYEKPFMISIDGEDKPLIDFKFDNIDIDESIKKCFKDTPIIVAEGNQGHIKAYVNSIIAMNEGEPWSQFESVIIGPSALSYKINQLTFHDPIIQALFGNENIKGNVKGMTGGYDIEKKGDARFISELTYLIKSNCTSGVGTESHICDMITSNQNDYLTAFKKVRDYLTLISTTFDCPKNLNVIEAEKPFDKENLRGMVLLLDLISNNLNSENLNCVLNIKDLKHLESPKEILNSLVNWHNEKIDAKTNPDDFEKGEPKPDTYVFNTRGVGPKNMKFRLQEINKFVSENCNDWVKLGYVNDKHIPYKKYKQKLLKNSNYKDVFVRGNSKIDLRTKVDVEHVISKKGKKANGDMDKVDNLMVTNPKSNKIKSNRY
tara:strand:+ start:125 stop:1678 length:1554 start_codon:yes stop_codon:yes gene_type:complete